MSSLPISPWWLELPYALVFAYFAGVNTRQIAKAWRERSFARLLIAEFSAVACAYVALHLIYTMERMP